MSLQKTNEGKIIVCVCFVGLYMSHCLHMALDGIIVIIPYWKPSSILVIHSFIPMATKKKQIASKRNQLTGWEKRSRGNLAVSHQKHSI